MNRTYSLRWSCLAWLLLAPCLLSSTTLAATVEISTVFAYPNSDPYDRTNLFGFNHAPNVTTLPDGSLMAVWFSGAFEGDVNQLILCSKSRDGGRTWSKAAIQVDIPHKSDFDPAFVVKGSKAWVIFVAGRWNRYPWVGSREAEQKQIGLDSYRLYIMRSDNSGETWTEPVVAVSRRGFCCRNGIVLKNGRILVPVCDESGNGKYTTSILRSDDDGANWHWVGQVNAADGKAGGEPAIVELDDGAVLLAMRSRDGHIWFARSHDAGDTWEKPYASDFDAAVSAQALFRNKAGQVFLAYDACKPPLRSPLVVRALNQKTLQWGEPLQIASAPPMTGEVWGSQVAYPSMTESADGSLVVVWTEISLAPEAQSGKIMAARVKF